MKNLKTVVLVVVATVFSVTGVAQEADEAISERVGGLAFVDEIQVTVVNVDVFVRDRKGRPVEGLVVDDFKISQNGVEMPISNFAELNAEVIRHRVAEAAMEVPVQAEDTEEGTRAAPEIKPICQHLSCLDRQVRHPIH